MSFVHFDHVGKIYQTGEVSITALQDVDFSIERGEICVIVGPSGAGKTTLLNILGGMDSATSGHIFLDGTDISASTRSSSPLTGGMMWASCSSSTTWCPT